MNCAGYIYKITNLKSGKMYIGQTSQTIEERWAVHLAWAKKRRSYLANAMIKCGISNFVIEPVVSVMNKEALDELEKELILSFGTIAPKGYNIFLGGSKGKISSSFGRRRNAARQTGRTHSEETKRKMSLAAKGKKKSRSHHAKLRKAVVCLETGIVYDGLSDAAKAIECRPSDIWNNITGRQNQVYGFSFIYEKDIVCI